MRSPFYTGYYWVLILVVVGFPPTENEGRESMLIGSSYSIRNTSANISTG